MNPIRLVAAWYVVLAVASSLPGQDVQSPPGVDSLFRETVGQLRNVNLSAGQIGQIQDLAARYGPQIKDAEQQAGLSESERRARDEAIARAVEKGLRGARARELLPGETCCTDERRTAFQRATRLQQEFDRAVLGLLTESQRSDIERPAKREAATSGFLIVQLASNLPLPPPSAETLGQAAAALHLPKLQGVIERFSLTLSERAVKPELLDRLDAKCTSASCEIRCLRTFWRIDTRAMQDSDVESALKSLIHLPDVASAYSIAEQVRRQASSRLIHPPEAASAHAPLEFEEPAAPGFADPSKNPYYGRQNYLDAAPVGIDAPASWSVTGGKGAGVGLVDFERAWNICHEDLKTLLRHPINGDIMPANDHGTSALGEIIAADNSVGIIGAAPRVDYVLLTSWYDGTSGCSAANVPNALAAALFFMDPGDVLLIEVSCNSAPIEIDKLCYCLIRLAVALGFIVIEPAGDGNFDLDAYLSDGMQILNRHSSCFRDSGAIMVGASDPAHGHNKAGASCYGSRVDCFGWGNCVTTTGSSPGDLLLGSGGDPDRSYRAMFNGTSSAAPMIAGAALLVQGLWKAKCGVALNSVGMRAILSDPLTGTPQGSGGYIGVMPNMKGIIAARGLGDSFPCCCISRRMARRQGFIRCR
jgi:hypothetical protein